MESLEDPLARPIRYLWRRGALLHGKDFLVVDVIAVGEKQAVFSAHDMESQRMDEEEQAMEQAIFSATAMPEEPMHEEQDMEDQRMEGEQHAIFSPPCSLCPAICPECLQGSCCRVLPQHGRPHNGPHMCGLCFYMDDVSKPMQWL